MMYLFSALVVLVAISIIPTVLSESPTIDSKHFTVPNCIKNNAGWWADGQIDDSSFVSGIQWLILNDVITIPSTQQGAGDGDNIIPNWVKSTAGWWAEDKIEDFTFVSAIRFLINEGIMIVGQVEQVEQVEQVDECIFKGLPVPCPDEKEVVEINDFHMEVNSGSCNLCVNWAYIGEEYYFQIETYDEKGGNYIDGVKINVKIVSKDGELRHNSSLITEDDISKYAVAIPNLDWYGENILSVTGEYNSIEKTIEKEFTVFNKSGGKTTRCINVNPFSVSSQELSPQGIAFNNDGSKMFIIGSVGDDVNEYWLSQAYCLGSASHQQSFSISGQDNDPKDLEFNADGTKMYVVGNQNDKVYEYALTTGFDLGSITYSSSDLAVGSNWKAADTDEDTFTSIAFNTAGTKIFLTGNDGDKVYECGLSTAFDVSTCDSHDRDDDLSITDEEKTPTGIAFNYDGKKMFVVGINGDEVNEYFLSTEFDVSTASAVATFDLSGVESHSQGIAFNSDGTLMFVIGSNGDDVNVYSLASAYVISTATLA